MVSIRIVAVPFGEAPIWVRESWLGCVLPVEKEAWATGKGVLTGQITDPIQKWYWVPRERAIEMLEVQGRSGAAAWWRDECPWPTEAGKEYFLFKPEYCEVVVLD